MKYTEMDMLDYIDGRLDDEQTAEFLATIRTDPEFASIVAAMQASQVPIAQAYAQQALPALPDALRVRVDELVSSKADQTMQASSGLEKGFGTTVWMGLAACLTIGVTIGMLFSQLHLKNNKTEVIASVPATLSTSPQVKHERFVNRVADYQSLYVENTVASLSTSRVEDARALLESIQKRSGVKIAILDYSSYGYEFVRAQELGFEGEPLVQLVYRKPGSAPLALCYMPGAETPSKALLMAQKNQLSSASWIANSQHYVLVADEDNDTLQQIYKHTQNAF